MDNGKQQEKREKAFRLKDLKQDRIFRYFFKKNEKALIHLLNSFLPLEKEQKIKKIKLMDDQIQAPDFDKKESILDIRMEMDSQGLANVEMQRFPEKHFRSRALFYACRLYSSQLDKGKKYGHLKPVYSLLICSKALFPELEEYGVFRLKCEDRPEILFSRDLSIVLVQLDKFKKTVEDKFDNLDFWCYILKNAPDIGRTEFVKLGSKRREFKEIMWHLRKLSKEESAKILEEYEEMRWRDEQARLEDYWERGIKQGMEKGIQQGRRQTAWRMLEKSLDPAQISEWTGLSEEEIRAMKKDRSKVNSNK